MNGLRLKVVSVVSALAVLASDGTLRGQDWHAANRATVRLKPSAFPELPVAVRRYLDGRFTSAGQIDIAVLCQRRQSNKRQAQVSPRESLRG